jgi:hypothetical protein
LERLRLENTDLSQNMSLKTPCTPPKSPPPCLHDAGYDTWWECDEYDGLTESDGQRW